MTPITFESRASWVPSRSSGGSVLHTFYFCFARFSNAIGKARRSPNILLLALALAAAAFLPACQSSTSSLKNVDVVYRFDNVRKTESFDEWNEVRAVLAKHANTVTSSVDGVRSPGGAGRPEVRSYKAVVNVPTIAAVDRIQADLEQLSSKRVAGDRIHFALANLQADYRSNILTAGVESIVGGYATPGYTVLVHPFEGAPPARTKAGSDGRWTQRLSTLPQTRWVYASVQDPARKLPDKFYRINISTQQQESIDASEYARLFPAAGSPPARSAVASAKHASSSEPAYDDDSDMVRARSAEDERVRLMREREEESRRKHRELNERIDRQLEAAEEARRRSAR